MWNAKIITAYPEMFPGTLGHSVIGKALSNKKWSLNIINLHNFGYDERKSIDDSPFGGGPGMIIRPDVVEKAVISITENMVTNMPLVYLRWVLLMVATSFGLLGAIDDYLKIKRNNSRGISSAVKIIWQIILSLVAIFLLMEYGDNEHLKNLYFPFFKNLVFHLGLFFIPFTIFIIVGSSNAVNLTDGLDGLATVPVMLVALSFTLICYVVGNTVFAEYLQIPYIADVGETAIFCGSIVGSCLGFLWFNAPPAKIFMGDTGSLLPLV